MTDILNIEDEPIFDDRIVKIETHAYNPFANTTFGYSDEIRIPIQQQDLYTLPYESFLYIEGKLTKNRVVEGSDVVLGNNFVAFLFDEIRYELDGVEIDRNRNVGVTSTLKHYVTTSSDRSVILRNAGWDAHTSADRYFNFCVPLYALLGFCEDYRRVIINARHELILIRSRNDNNCLMGNDGVGSCGRLIQDTMANTARVIERDKKTIDAAHFGERTILKHGFSLVTEYEGIQKQRQTLRATEHRGEGIAKTSRTAATAYNPRDHCWRCRQRGHTRFECRRPPVLFCSQCGKEYSPAIATRRETPAGSRIPRPRLDPSKLHPAAAPDRTRAQSTDRGDDRHRIGAIIYRSKDRAFSRTTPLPADRRPRSGATRGRDAGQHHRHYSRTAKLIPSRHMAHLPHPTATRQRHDHRDGHMGWIGNYLTTTAAVLTYLRHHADQAELSDLGE
ncbi:hypothetical protein P5V15_002852 [Pogonomyrmex californicus]